MSPATTFASAVLPRGRRVPSRSRWNRVRWSAPFSAAKPGYRLPRGWEALTFGSLKTPDRVLVRGGTTAQVVVRAKADASASGLIHPVNFDIKSRAVRSSSAGRSASLIEGADNRVASKEDSPVRIALGFDGDRSKLTLREKTASLLAKRATGRDLPYAQLVYVWANNTPVGTVIENPHTKRVEMVVAASGGAEVGKWVTLSRATSSRTFEGVRRGARAADGVGLMTDTDNTGEKVEAWYGDIRFLTTP